MKDFSYLDAEIDPPDWVSCTTCSIVVVTWVGFWIWLTKSTANNRSSYTGYSPRGARRF